MTMECRIKQKIDESETGYYLVAEVVNVLCDEKYLNEKGNALLILYFEVLASGLSVGTLSDALLILLVNSSYFALTVEAMQLLLSLPRKPSIHPR